MIARRVPFGLIDCVLLKTGNSPEKSDPYKKHIHIEEKDRRDMNIRFFPTLRLLCFCNHTSCVQIEGGRNGLDDFCNSQRV
jgi:hypothetical protein